MLPLDLLAQPPVAALIFFVLHTLDFLLTIAGERVRQRRAARVLCIPGSYELNPLFRKVVDERRWWSWRFVLVLKAKPAAAAPQSADLARRASPPSADAPRPGQGRGLGLVALHREHIVHA